MLTVNASEGTDQPRRVLGWIFLPFAVLLAFPATAAQWTFTPSVQGSEVYTDNVTLAPSSLKQSDWITQVVPRISINAIGPKLRFNLNYAPQILYYARDTQDKSDIYQNGGATLNAELADKLLFFDAGANVGQQNISLLGPITNSNVYVTGNRATVKTFYLSPYFLRDFGSQVRAELRYRFSATDSDQVGSTQDSNTNALALRLASGPAYSVLTWGLNYDFGQTDFKGQLNPDLDSETILGRARYLVTPSIGLLVRGGYESYKRGDVIPESNGWGWGGGVEWSPSPRTNLTAVTGKRFYGNSSNVDFRHRARLLDLRAGYVESVTTTTQQFFVPATSSTSAYLDQLYANTIPDPVVRQDTVNSVISQLGIPSSLNSPVNYFTNNLFVQKRLNGSIALRGVRNVIIANVFRDRRQAIIGSTFLPGSINPNNNTEQIGGSLSWSLQVTPRDGLSVLAGYSRNEFKGTSRVDDDANLGIGYTRQFQRKFSGSLSFRRQERDSTLGGSDYTENSIAGSVSITF
jgi:uncharacterized protein (PEP-CTERM system associated)